jgi:Gliding motility associated protein GldN
MKFLKILILGPLSILSLKSTAQVEDLMRDKNITWIGEFTSDFVVEGYKLLDTSDNVNSSRLLKYSNTNMDFSFDEETPLFAKIRNAGRDETPVTYEDSTCVKKINPYTTVDTIEAINPITDEKVHKLAFRCFYIPPTPRFYRVKQVLYYDKRKSNFGLRVLAIGLMVDEHNELGEVIGLKSEAWLKPNNVDSQKINLNSSDISIARRIASRSNSPCFGKNIRILKNTFGAIQETLINDLSNNPSIILYSKDIYYRELLKDDKYNLMTSLKESLLVAKTFKDSNRIASIKIDTIKSRVRRYIPNAFPEGKDTVKAKNRVDEDDAFPDFQQLTGDTTTYEEVTFVTEKSPEDSLKFNGIRELEKLQIIQDWYWDDKLRNICVRFFGFALMKKRYNDKGEYIFDEPLFYRLND